MKQSETKRNGGRCSSTGLRRMMAMLLAAMLTATAAWADETIYTVTLKPGEGTGTDITVQSTNIISRTDWLAGNYDQSHGCFYLDNDGKVYYVLPNYCPFTAPTDKKFDQWEASFGDKFSGGTIFSIADTGNFTITALYKDDVTASVRYSMPSAIEVEYGATETAFDIRVQSVTFGDNPELDIQLYDGTFLCDANGGTIPFTMTTNGNRASRGGNSAGNYGICYLNPDLPYPYACKGFINISNDALASAKPGNYTATLRYRYRLSITRTKIEGTIALTLNVPTSDIALADNADNADEIANHKRTEGCTVTLQGRTLYTDGDWNTLCLPFSLSSLSGTPLEGFTVMELDGQTSNLTDGTLTLNFTDATGIVAGKPYIVKKDATVIQASDLYCTAISGTPGFNYGEGFGSLVDGDKETKWRSNTGQRDGTQQCECEFKMASPVSVTGYTLTTGDDTGDNPDRNPTAWTLEARLSESDGWTTIDSRKVWDNEEDKLPGESFATKHFALAQQGTYQYFRFCVQRTRCELMQLAELTLEGTYTETVIENPKFKNVTINASEPQAVSSQDGKVSFKGSYAPVSIASEDKSILYLGAGNTLYYPSEAMTIGACRAYFQLAAGEPASAVRAFKLNFGDDGTTANPSAIHAIETGKDESAHHAWYSLDGRRLATQPATPGVYIYGGKKMVVK